MIRLCLIVTTALLLTASAHACPATVDAAASVTTASDDVTDLSAAK